MKTIKTRRTVCFLLIIYTLFSSLSLGISAEERREYELDGQERSDESSIEVLSDDVKVGSRLLELFLGTNESKNVSLLIPGGDVFGVKIKQNGVTVTDPGRIPALKKGDTILSVGGKEVHSIDDITSILKKSGGESLTVTARHKNEDIRIEIRPIEENGEYKLGVSLRDGALGIGTLTFIDPETGEFGGLGHGISDSDSGEVISMRSGDVSGVILGGIHKGEKGKPGELTGILTDSDLGDLYTNSDCGVFGVLDIDRYKNEAAVPVGRKSELHEGEASIISTVKNGKKAEYKIEITQIDRSSDSSKSFKIKVTDPTLKALTGGIVRGMSGSPIMQDGKLVGAVTHVMVADPTEGYGIFIENMLNSANMQNKDMPKAA